MICQIIQMAVKLGEPHFCARIIMHMQHMRISAIIILVLMLAIDGPLLSKIVHTINPRPAFVNQKEVKLYR